MTGTPLVPSMDVQGYFDPHECLKKRKGGDQLDEQQNKFQRICKILS